MKILSILKDIGDDFVSSKNLALNLIKYPEVDRRILIIGLVFILVITLFSVKTEPEFYILLVKLILGCGITFIIFTQSNTFWFLVKKAWTYHLILHNRKSIKTYYQTLLSSHVKKEKHPIAKILLITKNDATLYKDHLRRIFVEILILLIIMYYLIPILIFFNIILFFLMCLYIFLFEEQSSEFIREDFAILVNSIHTMYLNDATECRKFIYENETSEVRELETIYRVVKNFKK